MTNEELFRLYKEGDKTAETKLIEQNQGLCRKIAYKYYYMYNKRYEIDDLMQTALIGLWLSLPKYNPERGAFSTFAHIHIKGKITRFIQQTKNIDNMLYLDEPKGNSDSIEDTDTPQPWEIAEKVIFKNELWQIIKKLSTDTEFQVLDKKYRLRQTMQASEYGIAQQAIKKIREHNEFKKFSAGWFLDERTAFIKAKRYNQPKTCKSYSFYSRLEELVLRRLEESKKMEEGRGESNSCIPKRS